MNFWFDWNWFKHMWNMAHYTTLTIIFEFMIWKIYIFIKIYYKVMDVLCMFVSKITSLWRVCDIHRTLNNHDGNLRLLGYFYTIPKAYTITSDKGKKQKKESFVHSFVTDKLLLSCFSFPFLTYCHLICSVALVYDRRQKRRWRRHIDKNLFTHNNH